MKKVFIFLGCLILSASLFAQQPLVRLYMDDGSIREFDLDDIEEITHISRSHDMIMEVFQHDGVEDVYPAMSVSRLSFTTDSLDTRMFTAYVFDQPRHFAVSSIDSIVFSRLEPKVVDNITVVDSLSWADIISVDENTITFRAGSSLASAITTGWFVVSAPTQMAPDGFLRMVTGLRTQGDQLIATTEDGDLFDVIEDGVISFQISYSAEDLRKLYIDPLKREEDDLHGPDKSIEFVYKRSFADGLFELSGTLKFEPTLAFNLVVRRFIIRQLLVKLDCALSLEPKFTIKDEVEAKGKWPLGPKYPMPNMVVMVGPVPVVMNSYIDWQLGAEIKAMKNISVKNTFGVKMTAGMEYNRDSQTDRWRNLGSLPEMIWDPWPKLEFSMGVVSKLSIGPQLNMSFYKMHDLFNNFIWTAGFLEGELDFIKDPWWKINLGVELTGGVTSKKVKSLNYDLPYSITGKRTIIEARKLIMGVEPKSAAIGDTITLDGIDFGETQGASFVAFKTGPSVMPEDIVRAKKYIRWRDTFVEFIIPSGMAAPPGESELEVELLLNKKDYWNNIVPFTVLFGPSVETIVPDTVRIGKPMVIKGKRFGDTRKTSEVSFDGILVEEYEAWSDTEITVKVPEGIDDGMLTVEVEERISNEVPYVVAVPFIANIHPNEVFPGDEMVITGKYFDDLQNESFVSFNGVVAANYLTWSDKQIVLKVPDKIESGLLWVQVAGKNSNEKAYVVKEIEVSIMPPRIVIYEMMEGATEVEHAFEAYAKPDSVYRFTWQFDDGNSYSEVVQKGETSKVSHTYVDVKDGDIFYPSVELYDLEGKLLAMDDITIRITAGPDEITIGNVVWMTRNLDVDAGNNWYPTYRYTINDSVVSFTHKEYGRLYDWGTALNACPAGWQLPSKKNWDDLINYLGGVMVAGGKLKSKVTIEAGNPHNHPGWYAPNVDATNQIGFSALPGGSYTGDGLFGIGSFLGIGRFGMWWLADEYTWSDPEKNAWVYVISNNSGNVTRSNADKRYGHSIRCVKIVD